MKTVTAKTYYTIRDRETGRYLDWKGDPVTFFATPALFSVRVEALIRRSTLRLTRTEIEIVPVRIIGVNESSIGEAVQNMSAAAGDAVAAIKAFRTAVEDAEQNQQNNGDVDCVDVNYAGAGSAAVGSVVNMLEDREPGADFYTPRASSPLEAPGNLC